MPAQLCRTALFKMFTFRPDLRPAEGGTTSGDFCAASLLTQDRLAECDIPASGSRPESPRPSSRAEGDPGQRRRFHRLRTFACSPASMPEEAARSAETAHIHEENLVEERFWKHDLDNDLNLIDTMTDLTSNTAVPYLTGSADVEDHVATEYIFSEDPYDSRRCLRVTSSPWPPPRAGRPPASTPVAAFMAVPGTPEFSVTPRQQRLDVRHSSDLRLPVGDLYLVQPARRSPGHPRK